MKFNSDNKSWKLLNDLNMLEEAKLTLFKQYRMTFRHSSSIDQHLVQRKLVCVGKPSLNFIAKNSFSVKPLFFEMLKANTHFQWRRFRCFSNEISCFHCKQFFSNFRKNMQITRNQCWKINFNLYCYNWGCFFYRSSYFFFHFKGQKIENPFFKAPRLFLFQRSIINVRRWWKTKNS